MYIYIYHYINCWCNYHDYIIKSGSFSRNRGIKPTDLARFYHSFGDDIAKKRRLCRAQPGLGQRRVQQLWRRIAGHDAEGVLLQESEVLLALSMLLRMAWWTLQMCLAKGPENVGLDNSGQKKRGLVGMYRWWVCDSFLDGLRTSCKVEHMKHLFIYYIYMCVCIHYNNYTTPRIKIN